MIKTRKKQLLLILFVSASLISLVFGTQGAYAALKMETPTVKNSCEPMENLKPTINETFVKNNDDVLEKKDVTVTNNNEFDVYVRAKVIVSWQDANGNTLAVTPLEGTDYTVEYGTDWTKKADGYYYYNKPLGDGQSTTDLLSGVSFSFAMGNIYKDSTMKIKVRLEAVQAANNGSNVLEAIGWTSVGEGGASQ